MQAAVCTRDGPPEVLQQVGQALGLGDEQRLDHQGSPRPPGLQALELARVLDIEKSGGGVRIGPVHYNTLDEIDASAGGQQSGGVPVRWIVGTVVLVALLVPAVVRLVRRRRRARISDGESAYRELADTLDDLAVGAADRPLRFAAAAAVVEAEAVTARHRVLVEGHAPSPPGLPVLLVVSSFMHAIAITPAGPGHRCRSLRVLTAAFPIFSLGRLPH
mgnify:CR=1 FL=1